MENLSTFSEYYIETIHIIHITFPQLVHIIVSIYRDDVIYPHSYPQIIHFSIMRDDAFKFSTISVENLSPFIHHNSRTVTFLLFIHTRCGQVFHTFRTIYRFDTIYPHKMWISFPHFLTWGITFEQILKRFILLSNGHSEQKVDKLAKNVDKS